MTCELIEKIKGSESKEVVMRHTFAGNKRPPTFSMYETTNQNPIKQIRGKEPSTQECGTAKNNIESSEIENDNSDKDGNYQPTDNVTSDEKFTDKSVIKNKKKTKRKKQQQIDQSDEATNKVYFLTEKNYYYCRQCC